MDKEIKEIILRILEDRCDVDRSAVTDESNLEMDLGADSLDRVELVMELEKEFKITISDDEAEKLETFADIVATVEALTTN